MMPNTDSADLIANEVLAFWFGEGEEHGRKRVEWFKKDATFDDEIRRRFIPAYQLAAAGRFYTGKTMFAPALR